MLRALLVVLVAANLLFLGFTRGWFDGIGGLSSLGGREPERLANQVRPQSIRVLPMNVGAARDSAPTACWEAGPFSSVESLAVAPALKSNLPAGSWTDNRSESGAGNAVVVTHTYRVDAADAALAARLGSLKLDAAGRGFSPCAKAEQPR